MKEIRLTQGQVALIDDEDYEAISRHSWCAAKHYGSFYAVTTISYKHVPMQVFILQPFDDQEVDHKNGNSLDNRRDNLRRCTHQQNLCNRRIFRTNTSGFKGVHWDSTCQRWRARLKLHGKWVNIGRYPDKLTAALAYNDTALRYFGEFARLNEIPT